MSGNPREFAPQGDLYVEGMGIVNDYTFDPGVCVLPIAEDPPESEGDLITWSPVVVLRLHAPYRVRRVGYSASKQSTPPILPTPQQDVGSFVFIGGGVTLTNQLNSGSFTFDWSGSSEYTFVENCVSRSQDGLVLGSPPWLWKIYRDKPTSTPTVGAAAKGGHDVLVGVSEASTQVDDAQTGELKPLWTYTIPSFYGGQFFNDYMVNGGVPTA